MKHGEGRGARLRRRRTSTCPSDATQADVLAAIRAFNDDPRVDAHPRPAPDAAADRLRRRAARDRSRQGRRRHAPGEHGPARADRCRARCRARRPGIEALLAYYEIPVAGPRGVHPRPRHHARPPARAAALAEAADRQRRGHRRAHRRARLAARTRSGPRSSSPPPACPASSSPSTSRPGVVVVGGGVRYEGRKLLPDVDERCEEVAGAITPRVGGVGPTTIAMLFRNAVEAAERRARARGDERTSPSASRPPAPAPAVCPLCGAAGRAPTAMRCRECGTTLAGVGRARRARSRRRRCGGRSAALLAIYAGRARSWSRPR